MADWKDRLDGRIVKKEEQEILPDKEMECEAERNGQEISAEAFKGEMTLVYLMLKDEFSGEKMDWRGDKVSVPAEVKFPKGIHVKLKDVKPIHISVPPEPDTKKKIGKFHPAMEHKKVEVVKAKPADISVRLGDIVCNKIAVPSVPKLRNRDTADFSADEKGCIGGDGLSALKK